MANQDDEITQDKAQHELSDEFTGLLPPTVEEEGYKRDVVALFAQNDAFQQMTNTKGWHLLEKFIEQQIDWMLQLLRVEIDHDKIKRIQAEILAFESLFKIIEVSFVNSEQAKKHLLDMVSGVSSIGN